MAPSPDPFRIQCIEGLKPSKRRAVVFLASEEHETDAEQKYASLKGNKKRDVLSRFDYWIDGGRNDKWFHGWPNQPEYKECWEFKWKEQRTNQRLYGFLYHPMPRQNGAFLLCVLVWHSTKTDETDRTILDRLNGLRRTQQVLKAIGKKYPDETWEQRKWIH
jgi:hypothetical protein